MLVALIQAILTKTKQNQKEARNDDQLQPNCFRLICMYVTGNREGVICYSGCFSYN